MLWYKGLDISELTPPICDVHNQDLFGEIHASEFGWWGYRQQQVGVFNSQSQNSQEHHNFHIQCVLYTHIERGWRRRVESREERGFCQFLLWVLLLELRFKIFYWNTHLRHWWNAPWHQNGQNAFNFCIVVQTSFMEAEKTVTRNQ